MRFALAYIALVTSGSAYAAPQQFKPNTPVEALSYPVLADFALASKVTAHVRIRSVRALKAELAVGTRPGFQRQLVTADVIALIRAPEGQPAQLRYIVDLPLDSRGRVPKLRGTESLVFATPARPGELRLISPESWVTWTPEADATVRAILTEAMQPDAPPLVRGINSAFHSPGSLPGEGETQIFLDAADNRPASLTVQRRPNEAPRWFVSLGEVVDEGVSQPAVNSLLWYRLACFLPQQMPNRIVEGQDPADAQQVRSDYAMIMQALGPCNRSRGPATR